MLNEDVALHFNPRFKENCVVRNTRINGKWMSEERDGGMSFFPGRTFELRITVKPNCYEVSSATILYITISSLQVNTIRHK